MKPTPSYTRASAIVNVAKKSCGISEDNSRLTDTQIGKICRHIAAFAPDTIIDDGKLQYGEIGISVMLSIALYEFPWFYQKYELWQRN